jgi:asparagine synthase (glutamine-hydrolysing)
MLPESLKVGLRKIRNHLQRERFFDNSLISPDFAHSVDIHGRRERLREMFPGTWTDDYSVERSQLIVPNLAGGRERYARIAAACGVEAADPFLDQRVVDYATRLPGRVLMKNGWPKMILRNLMTGRLPDEVLWCRGKPHLGWVFNQSVTTQAVKNGSLEQASLQSALQPYVEKPKLAAAWQEFRDSADTEKLHTAHVLATWLRENANRPVVPDSQFGYSGAT